MPFITQERRKAIADTWITESEFKPGDLCYVFYKDMVRQWKENPCWTTAHKIYQTVMTKRWSMAFVDRFTDNQLDAMTAYELAWQVFFQLYVMPYE